ncbi:ribonuclease domain-containing protein [Burkholderia cepacia]|uniref:ribonuclease domain-containing protein n=1 Tax=Burkholderia cepacia TaxID=292 RepID=UPI0038CD9459
MDPWGLTCGSAAGAPKDPIARIAPGSLPAAEESALLNTLSHIDNGTVPTGPLAKKWGTQFKNWAGDLPGGQGPTSPYREYRVAPSPGTTGAGANRIVANSQTGEMYYTWTHYGDAGNPAFVQIR